jgi:hypothetical protein
LLNSNCIINPSKGKKQIRGSKPISFDSLTRTITNEFDLSSTALAVSSLPDNVVILDFDNEFSVSLLKSWYHNPIINFSEHEKNYIVVQTSRGFHLYGKYEKNSFLFPKLQNYYLRCGIPVECFHNKLKTRINTFDEEKEVISDCNFESLENLDYLSSFFEPVALPKTFEEENLLKGYISEGSRFNTLTNIVKTWFFLNENTLIFLCAYACTPQYDDFKQIEYLKNICN